MYQTNKQCHEIDNREFSFEYKLFHKQITDSCNNNGYRDKELDTIYRILYNIKYTQGQCNVMADGKSGYEYQ